MHIRFPAQLTEHLAAIAPIEGVRITDPDDRSTWAIRFKEEATPGERAAAEAALLTFEAPAEVTPLTGDDLAELLKKKGVLTDNDIKGAREAKASKR